MKFTTTPRATLFVLLVVGIVAFAGTNIAPAQVRTTPAVSGKYHTYWVCIDKRRVEVVDPVDLQAEPTSRRLREADGKPVKCES